MFQLRCTVRKCLSPLELREGGLFCSAGHHFDRAREGYWSLLQPQDRRSLTPGDSDAAVLARQRWLAKGYAKGLVQELAPWMELNMDGGTCPRTLDLGCGEGSFGPTLFANEAAGYCGIDLSKKAIKLAARRWPDATWVLSNADRILPVADASIQRVVSLFGRRPVVEIQRVLVPGGICVIAVPGEDDLIELRERVQQAGHRRSRWELVVDELAKGHLEFVEHKLWQEQVELEPDSILDALAMTYRGVRHSQQERLQDIPKMAVTLAADLLLFRPKAD